MYFTSSNIFGVVRSYHSHVHTIPVHPIGAHSAARLCMAWHGAGDGIGGDFILPVYTFVYRCLMLCCSHPPRRLLDLFAIGGTCRRRRCRRRAGLRRLLARPNAWREYIVWELVCSVMIPSRARATQGRGGTSRKRVLRHRKFTPQRHRLATGLRLAPARLVSRRNCLPHSSGGGGGGALGSLGSLLRRCGSHTIGTATALKRHCWATSCTL